MDEGEGGCLKSPKFCGRHMYMAPKHTYKNTIQKLTQPGSGSRKRKVNKRSCVDKWRSPKNLAGNSRTGTCSYRKRQGWCTNRRHQQTMGIWCAKTCGCKITTSGGRKKTTSRRKTSGRRKTPPGRKPYRPMNKVQWGKRRKTSGRKKTSPGGRRTASRPYGSRLQG